MVTHSLIFAMFVQFGGLSGQVRDARTHGAIRMASVELWNSQAPVDRTYTDLDGGFRFAVLGTGHFTVVVNYPEYETSYVQIDAPMAPIMIELVRKQSSATNLRPSVSVREFRVPKSAREEFDRARKEVSGGNCAKAIAHFQKGLRIFNDDASAHNDLGNCYRKLGELDNAENSFNRARALSDSVYIRLNLAEVYTVQKRFEEAETILLEAIRNGSHAGDAYYGLALVYFQQNLPEKAVAAGLQAHDYPHQIADVHLVLAEIYLREHKSADVLKQLQMYLKEAPKGALSESVRQLLKNGGLDNARID
jgi:tetratricopeptide (TPR) repeat protein